MPSIPPSSPAQQTDRDLALFLKLDQLEKGQQQLTEDLHALAPLLEKMLTHLTTPPSPAIPVASYGQLYPDWDDAPLPDAEPPVPAPLPAQPGGWRRCFRARSTKVVAGFTLVVVGLLPFYRINLTASAPRGVWAVHRVPAALERGMWVTLPAPASVAPWAPRWVPLLKQVAAVPGDQVCVTQQMLTIRGQSYGYVAHYAADGSPVPHLKEGCFTVEQGRAFLANHVPQSLDSRYFSSVPVSTLTARLTPLFTWR